MPSRGVDQVSYKFRSCFRHTSAALTGKHLWRQRATMRNYQQLYVPSCAQSMM